MKTMRVLSVAGVGIVLIGGLVFARQVILGKVRTPVAKSQFPGPIPTEGAVTSDLSVDPRVQLRMEAVSALESEAKGLMKEKKWDEAKLRFEEALNDQYGKDMTWMYCDLGEVQYQQGHFQDSLESMKKAFFGKWRGLESKALPLVRFAEVAEKCGEMDLAAKIWEQAADVGQSMNSDIREARSRKLSPNQSKALALVAAGQEALAKEDLEREPFS